MPRYSSNLVVSFDKQDSKLKKFAKKVNTTPSAEISSLMQKDNILSSSSIVDNNRKRKRFESKKDINRHYDANDDKILIPSIGGEDDEAAQDKKPGLPTTLYMPSDDKFLSNFQILQLEAN